YLVARDVTLQGQWLRDTAALRQSLLTRLPDYMVPVAFVELERLPLTPNGKLDVKALPAPDLTSDVSIYRAPHSAHEILLCSLVAELTGVTRVGLDDSFFAIGGHSLLAMRLIARVRQTTGLDLPLRTLFESPTPVALASYLDRAQIGSDVALTAGMGVLSDGQIALSFGQQRLWSLDQLQGASATYNIPYALRLKGSLNIDALAQALALVMARHESLRTVMRVNEQGEAIGRLLAVPQASTLLPMVDLGALSLEQCIHDEAGTPFDLGNDYSLRARLLKINASEFVLLLTLHHQASDGASISVFVRELTQAYNCLVTNQTIDWSALPIQYSDWAAWQLQTLEPLLDEKIERAKQRLGELPESLSLPLDFPREAKRARRAGHQPLELSAELTQALSALATREGTTLFAVLLGSFAATLGRLANQNAVVIGAPVSGRTRMETEDLIGFLVNTLAVPIRIDSECSGFDLIARARSSLEDALADQDLPFERLVDGLGVARSLAQTPLFQAMFSYQNELSEALNFEGLSVDVEPVYLPTAKCDLTLHMVLSARNTLVGTLEYDADLFSEVSVKRWCDAIFSLTEALVSKPEQAILALPLMERNASAQVIAESEGRAVELADGLLTLPELFEAQVIKSPNAIALVFEDQSISYLELEHASNRLAHYLIEQGVGSEQVVAILLDRCPEMIIGMLAVLKAGAAYLPLDPEYPADRLTFMLADSGARLLVSTAARLEDLKPRLSVTDQASIASLTLIDVADQDLNARLRACSHIAPTNLTRLGALHPQHLAYLIYTSGSTGRPKGVGNAHRAVVNHMDWMQDTLALGPADRILQKTAIGFDVAVFEWFVPLMAGATLVIARPGGHRDPAYLRLMIRKHGITVIHFVTSMLNAFLDDLEGDDCPTLRQIVSSGEAVTGPVQHKTFEHFPNVLLWDFYGPTEAAIHVSTWQCQPSDGYRSPPIGYPIWNTQLYILDTNLQPVPHGIVGELYIAGEGVARGYIGRAALTAERFIASPFGPPGLRMYRTGDLARRRMDHAIEYLGRADGQLKIRGYRIELGEIEVALLKSFGDRLARAVVVVRERGEDKRLVAYLVPREQEALPSDVEIRSVLGRTLPDYMVPSAFVELERLPLTPNGKLDVKALPEPD
ncbi:MAG: hypothetical protein RI904_2457, partial [Pseudomonadota bacterium]